MTSDLQRIGRVRLNIFLWSLLSTISTFLVLATSETSSTTFFVLVRRARPNLTLFYSLATSETVVLGVVYGVVFGVVFLQRVRRRSPVLAASVGISHLQLETKETVKRLGTTTIPTLVSKE